MLVYLAVPLAKLNFLVPEKSSGCMDNDLKSERYGHQKKTQATVAEAKIRCLEEWASLDKGHCISLLGAIEALKASTLRLPVVGGATADIQSLKDAVGSAVDVMQTMLSSIHSYLPKVEEVNSLVNELANVTAKERASLAQCKGFLSNLATLEVKDCSLRTHMLQHKFKRKPTI
ncbi:hypothetical protein LIER_15497 [Lithospermum erythrorhizon]|uniref:Uncharacterized protein n=1 Tax=Lithospermum erythrorhizon TaxID=34254 RepID=A0AAV3Q8F5_LITER